MFGNPFDNTITIEKNGQVITEKINDGPCDKCDKIHVGRCRKRMKIGRGRFFFIEETDLECIQCGAKFGGGSTSRPGGSGLASHLRSRGKGNGCGKKWEEEYWIKTIKDWEK